MDMIKLSPHSIPETTDTDFCCVCLKIQNSCTGTWSWKCTADGRLLGVCSAGCKQALLFSSGFAKGFVLCYILSHLFENLTCYRTSKLGKSDILPDCETKETGSRDIDGFATRDLALSLDTEKLLDHERSSDNVNVVPRFDAPCGAAAVETDKVTGGKQAVANTVSCRQKAGIEQKGGHPSSQLRQKRRYQTKRTASSCRVRHSSKPATEQQSKQKMKMKKKGRSSYQGKSEQCNNKRKTSTRPGSKFVGKCGIKFASENLCTQNRQVRHSNICHEQNKNNSHSATPTCHLCNRCFQSKWALNYHNKRKHSTENTVECEFCGKEMNGMFDLQEHKRKAHRNNHLCHICGRKFFSSNALTGHLEVHSGVKSYFCEECGAGFMRKTSLASHQQLHTKLRTFLCDICSQCFKTRARLNDHMMNVHHSGPYFENRVRRLKALGIVVDGEAIARLANGLCTVCAKKLDGGICPCHTDANQKLFTCTLCGKVESDIVSLYHHSKWHRGEDVEGSVMDKSFPSHGLPGYECKTCFKRFTNKNYLIKHMHQHREKRFSCDVCGKHFTYRWNLKNHATAHSQTRPFECHFCHKAFKLKYTLDNHQRNHCREADVFKCDICGKGLLRKESLEKHYRQVHPDAHAGEVRDIVTGTVL